MFKVRVDVKGFDKYTGLLGTVNFTNGVSDREVTDLECARLGAIMRIVRLDTDEQVGASTNMVKSRDVPAEVKEPMAVEVEPKAKAEPAPLKYTKETLDAMAEADGMKAIRKIADEYGIKGVQISKMIEEIIEAQQPKED
jgi:hypothetical protein